MSEKLEVGRSKTEDRTQETEVKPGSRKFYFGLLSSILVLYDNYLPCININFSYFSETARLKSKVI